MRCDLLVVGAGPAGTAAAIAAANRGLDVLVVDKATFPRDKTCGDGLTTAALRLLERLGFSLDAVPSYARVTEGVLVSPSGRHVTLPLPGDGERVGVVPRVELDAALVDFTRRRGARVREGAGLAAITTRPDGVRADLTDGTVVHAPWVIAADGHYSTVRRLLAPERAPALGEWSAFRQYWRGVEDPRLWIFLERDLLPGYAWVFPLPGGRANVGFGMRRGPGVTGRVLEEHWQTLPTRPSLRAVLGERAEPEGRHRAWPIPSRLDLDALHRERVLFAGDAAGVVDPMTGEGIAQALETGMLAAAAVARGGDRAGTLYRGAVRHALAADLRFASVLQHVLARPWGARASIRAVDVSAWTRRNFARWLFEDYPRAVLLTPRRWRPGMLTGPGAYRR